MKLLPFALESVIVQPIWDMDSLEELASGVEFRPLITFHMSFPLVLVMAPSRSSFQLSVLTLLMTFFFNSLHALILSCWLVLMGCCNLLRVRILACT